MEQEQKDQLLSEAAQQIALNPPQDDVGEQVVVGLAQAELTGRTLNAAENQNLAEELDEETLKEVSKLVWDGFETDQKSRTSWLEDHAFWLSLYMQKDYAENGDSARYWGATESIPILTEACDMFQSRTYKSFFPQDTFVSAIPMRKTIKDREALEQRAEKIGRHMSYQLGYEDRAYRMDKDALFLGVAVHGSFFTKTYYNQKKKRFQVDNVRPTDLVINYHVGPIRIDQCRRKTHVIYSTVGETDQLTDEGFFTEPAKAGEAQVDKQYNIKVDEVTGISDPQTSDKRDALAVLLEQHCYLDIMDGVYRPYIVTICAASRKVLRLTIGYEADETGAPLNDYEQIQYFTHYKYKENPDGFYGLGLGSLIGDLNSAANIMLRQSMDAATLANDGNMSGFISERMGLEGDEIHMELGKLRKVPDTIGDFQNAIMMMQFPGPNAALMQIMEHIDLRAQRLGSVTEATTGTVDKVQQPTAIIAQIEQALEQFSSVQMRLANSLCEELQKIYKINQKYLPLVSYFVVNGDPETITRTDYADDMLIQPVFDPKYSTQAQKVARAQAELAVTLQNPVNAGRPQVIDEACRRVLKAMDVEDIESLVPPQPQIENFDDQRVENMFFIMPPEARPLFDVFPDQNHQLHLMVMADLDMYAQVLQPEQIEAILKHRLKHEAYLYGQKTGVIPTQSIPTPPLEARSDNPVDNGASLAAIPPQEAAGLADLIGVPDPMGYGSVGDGSAASSGGDQAPM